MQEQEEQVLLLTFEELDYLAKACRMLPNNEKDERLIVSLTKKLTYHKRLGLIKEMFPGTE